MRLDASSFIAVVAAEFAATMTRGLTRVSLTAVKASNPTLAKTKKA
jgi:hypothetical protein